MYCISAGVPPHFIGRPHKHVPGRSRAGPLRVFDGQCQTGWGPPAVGIRYLHYCVCALKAVRDNEFDHRIASGLTACTGWRPSAMATAFRALTRAISLRTGTVALPT